MYANMKINRITSQRMLALLLTALLLLPAGCSNAVQTNVNATESTVKDGDVTLVIGAYSVVKDAFADILPAFQAYWLEETGQKVTFQESYEASGTQARAIAGGFEADVAVLAMEGDLDKIADAGFITHNWKTQGSEGMITNSVVVLGTREGNPKGIKDWDDLTRKGVKVLYPNPKTSGGAQWDINAIYGAGLKKSEEKTGTKNPEYAKSFLKAVHANVESLDKSGRASMAAFEYGVGDVIVTYENELLARIKKGVKYDIVVPKSTILIQNPAAVVDKNVEKHGTRKVAEAFIAFLHKDETQRLFVEHGFRSVNENVAEDTKDRYIVPEELFDITYLGGWSEVKGTLYSKKGVWYQVLADL